MENFINQRKDGAFRKLNLGEKLQNMPPSSANNAVMSGIFSAINEDLDTSSHQSYELAISFGYVITSHFCSRLIGITVLLDSIQRHQLKYSEKSKMENFVTTALSR